MIQCLFFLICSLLLSVSRATISIVGRQIRIDDVPFHMKGVNWNPIGKGKTHPGGLDFTGYVEQDSKLMIEAGINLVRTYEPLTDRTVLDKLWEHRIYVISTVYPYGGSAVSTAVDHVNAVKDHPAILMWAVGNEWNYNGLYSGLPFNQARTRIRDVVRAIKAVDKSHPVSTIYGELPDAATLDYLQEVDVWGINAYRNIGFGNLFQDWGARSGKPMYMGEYGADAYDARNGGRENQAAQAEATTVLTELIVAQSSVNVGGICSGGIIFELADEWWKDGAGSLSVHDVGGIAPGGGPYPDLTFNEEWWGLVDIDRVKRLAFTAYANVAIPASGTGTGTGTGAGTGASTTIVGSGTGTDKTCEEVLNDLAGEYTCGARIEFLKSEQGGSMAEDQARDRVAEEYPNECGACRTPSTTTTTSTLTCAAVLDNDAAGHSCGDRIDWLMQNRGMTRMQAGNVVADEFPDQCGACRQYAPSPDPETTTATTTTVAAPNPGPTTTSLAATTVSTTVTTTTEYCAPDLFQHCWFFSQSNVCDDSDWKESMWYWCKNTCFQCKQPASIVGAREASTRPSLPAGPKPGDLWAGLNASTTEELSVTTEVQSGTTKESLVTTSQDSVAAISPAARNFPLLFILCSLVYCFMH